MKIVTIVGARPQFIKAAAFSRAIKLNNLNNHKIEEIIIHTGQHFDSNMSEVFFSELDIPKPHINLEISGLSHAAMTGRMLEEIEKILLEIGPDVLLIYGDTNSTLAAALAASKIHIPIAHVEAGLRSFNNRMPEEINRIVADRLSKYLFCPTDLAVKNLNAEGIIEGVYLTGDVMLDVTNYCREKAEENIDLNQWNIKQENYVLTTIHRAENTDDPYRLKSILNALKEISRSIEVVMPIHPRTKQLIVKLGYENLLKQINVIDPVSYIPMTKLQMNAKAILTDSGGVQKEAFFHNVPCITLRDETEWIETVELGWNTIVGADFYKILHAFTNIKNGLQNTGNPYGNGNASNNILQILKANYL